MTTTREDPTKRDLPKAAKEPSANGEPAKKIDPWHFGAHTVPPNLRAELSNIELPDAPAERRYRLQARAAESTEPTEELRVPKRDFRRSVAIGLGLLVVVVGAAAAFRCSTNGREEVVPPPPTQPAATERMSETPEMAAPAPAATGAATSQHIAVEPAVAATSAVPPNARSKPASAGTERPRAAGAAAQPASGLDVSSSLPNPLPPEAPASSGRKLVLEPR